MARSRTAPSLRTAPAVVLTAMLTASWVLSGCASTSPPGSPSAAPNSQPPASSSAGATTTPGPDASAADSTASGGGDADDGTTADDGIAYLPWGPDDPPVPDQYTALAAAPGAPPRCDAAADAQRDEPFWAFAAAVCGALTADAPWPPSDQIPAPPPAENAFQSCLDDELTGLLRAALRWHADHPGQRPKLAYPARSSRSPCQFRVYGVEVLAPAEGGSEVGDEVAVAITASGLDEDPAVTVEGLPTPLETGNELPDPGVRLRTIVVRATVPERPRAATIELKTPAGTLTATVGLPGREDPEPTPGEEPTEVAAPGSVAPGSPTEPAPLP